MLISHSDVADAGVIGVPDVEFGEVPFAWVVRKPETSVNEYELQRFVSGTYCTVYHVDKGILFWFMGLCLMFKMNECHKYVNKT